MLMADDKTTKTPEQPGAVKSYAQKCLQTLAE